MDTLTVAIWGLALSLAGNGVLWFFKSPRQESEDLAERITSLDTRLSALSMRYEGSNGRNTHALESMAKAIDRLTQRFDDYMGRRNERA